MFENINFLSVREILRIFCIIDSIPVELNRWQSNTISQFFCSEGIQ
jgi:hypothetical protein